ncbi:MAG: hypothetical protein ACE5EC_00235 [Phycisphaerae bacterium]
MIDSIHQIRRKAIGVTRRHRAAFAPFRRRRRFTLPLLLWAVTALMAAPSAWAQSADDPSARADNIEKLEMERPIVEYVCAGGFLMAAMAIGFKPSKRTHD